MIDKVRMNDLYGHTLWDIKLALSDKAPMKNRILMIESSIERYHAKRYFITGRYNNQRAKVRRKNRKLSRENRALRKEISVKTKHWWKFW